jgi:hypothetical protein
MTNFDQRASDRAVVRLYPRRSERESNIASNAGQVHALCIAAELMEGMFDELKVLGRADPILSRELMIEGCAISEQLAELQGVVIQLSGASNPSDEFARAISILRPLSRRLEALAQNFEARES